MTLISSPRREDSSMACSERNKRVASKNESSLVRGKLVLLKK